MLNLLKFDVKRMKQRVIVVAFKTPLKSKIGNLYLQKFTSASTRWIYWFHIKLSPESEERPPYPRLGGSGQKEGPKIWLNIFVTAYRDTRTELTKNWFHTFPLSVFIFI